ncbi:hypothetical protein Pint_21631 [Pistacia integerrima]|uniref:Uncharacterized protein n=1 Tax=Pistacia integerrima TaxID=434235 RepID=A0ACC0XCT2_9ROSI|nr:hypothetical protein Pint_21631 [Pistacia integerrima]
MAVELIGGIAGAGSFVLDVVKCLAAPIGRPFKYLYNYKKNIDNLQDGVKNLKNTSEEVQVKVAAAERNVEEIKQSVKDWQSKANNTITEAEKLTEEKENNPRCFKQEDKVSYPTIHKEIWLRSNEDYLAFESRNSTVKDVWDALNDENIYMMGVYGMGGLGKTTLVHEVGRQAEKDKLFEEIALVEVMFKL